MNRRKNIWSTLKNQATFAIRKKRMNPEAKIAGDPSRTKKGDKGGGGDIIKPPFDVGNESRGFEARTLNCPDLMSKGGAGIKSAKARERTALIAIEKSRRTCELGKTGGRNPL